MHRVVICLIVTVGMLFTAAPVFAARGLVVFDGNSLVTGAQAGPGRDFPSVMYRRSGGSFIKRNVAVSGQDIPAMAADAAAQIDPMFKKTRAYNVVVAWEIRNSFILFRWTPGQAVAEFADYCRARQAAGFRVIVLTVLPTDAYDKPPGFDSDRATMNADIRAHWRRWADGIADVAASHYIGDDGDSLDLAYYAPGGVHLNNAGQRVVAHIVTSSALKMLHRAHL